MFSTKLFSIVLIGFAFLACGSAVRCEANEFEVQSQGRYEQVVAAHRAKMATYKDFRRLSRFIVGPQEKWQEIPWIPGLLQGVEASRAKNKPMFIWAMNGDPLGCV